MNNTANIILWTTSICLSILSICFALIAAYNSSKANLRLKEMMNTSWVEEESQKLFFLNIKNIQKDNSEILRNITRKITYSRYDSMSKNTRLPIISNKIVSILKESEYKSLTIEYLKEKNELDILYNQSINVENIHTKKIIPESEKESIIKYHNKIKKNLSKILKNYAAISK